MSRRKAVIVFTQNLIIKSISNVSDKLKNCEEIILLTSHQLFDYEVEQIREILEKDITAFSFIDFLSMDELVYCDKEAFKYENKMLLRYDEKIKEIKNELVFKNFESRIYPDVRLILCDDLGIDKNVWLKKGYIYIKCEYYFNPPKESFLHEIKTTFKKMPVIKNIVKKRTG